MVSDRFKMRAWDTVNKMMWEPHTFSMASFGDDQGWWPCRDGRSIHDHPEKMIPLQCTGRNDKHGNLIFESHIVRGTGGILYVVEWDGFMMGLSFHRADGKMVPCHDEALDVEIVGDIYQDAELVA